MMGLAQQLTVSHGYIGQPKYNEESDAIFKSVVNSQNLQDEATEPSELLCEPLLTPIPPNFVWRNFFLVLTPHLPSSYVPEIEYMHEICKG